MARPGLDRHPKFRRLMHMLGERRSHVRGYLECLWETAYETGNPVIGDDLDIELAADWPGEPGKLSAALLNCGGEGRVGFIEEVVTDCNAVNKGLRNSVTKTFQVHDLFDHAPEYVTHRRTKEVERRKAKQCQRCGNEFHSTETHAKFCSDTCRVSAYRERHSEAATTGPQHPVTDGNGGLRFCNAPLRTVTGSNEPPAPAPAPAPAPNEREGTLALPGSLDTERFRFAWAEFLEHLRHKTGQVPSDQWTEVNLMECCRRGVDKAIRDIRFSIEKNAKSLLDGSVRYNGNGDGKPKPSAAERKAVDDRLRREGIAKREAELNGNT